MKLVLLLMMLSIIGGVFSRWRQKDQPDLDQQVLDQLKKAGSDLSKPHNIEFFLYFPKESSAHQAAKDIKVEVDNVNVELGADKTNWLCFATRRMVPKHDDLVRLRKVFNEIAAKYDGVYDGWGTAVEK